MIATEKSMVSAAWQAGFQAGQSKLEPDCCPYPVGSAGAWSWWSGYLEGAPAAREYEVNKESRL